MPEFTSPYSVSTRGDIAQRSAGTSYRSRRGSSFGSKRKSINRAQLIKVLKQKVEGGNLEENDRAALEEYIECGNDKLLNSAKVQNPLSELILGLVKDKNTTELAHLIEESPIEEYLSKELGRKVKTREIGEELVAYLTIADDASREQFVKDTILPLITSDKLRKGTSLYHENIKALEKSGKPLVAGLRKFASTFGLKDQIKDIKAKTKTVKADEDPIKLTTDVARTLAKKRIERLKIFKNDGSIQAGKGEDKISIPASKVEDRHITYMSQGLEDKRFLPRSGKEIRYDKLMEEYLVALYTGKTDDLPEIFSGFAISFKVNYIDLKQNKNKYVNLLSEAQKLKDENDLEGAKAKEVEAESYLKNAEKYEKTLYDLRKIFVEGFGLRDLAPQLTSCVIEAMKRGGITPKMQEVLASGDKYEKEMEGLSSFCSRIDKNIKFNEIKNNLSGFITEEKDAEGDVTSRKIEWIDSEGKITGDKKLVSAFGQKVGKDGTGPDASITDAIYAYRKGMKARLDNFYNNVKSKFSSSASNDGLKSVKQVLKEVEKAVAEKTTYNDVKSEFLKVIEEIKTQQLINPGGDNSKAIENVKKQLEDLALKIAPSIGSLKKLQDKDEYSGLRTIIDDFIDSLQANSSTEVKSEANLFFDKLKEIEENNRLAKYDSTKKNEKSEGSEKTTEGEGATESSTDTKNTLTEQDRKKVEDQIVRRMKQNVPGAMQRILPKEEDLAQDSLKSNLEDTESIKELFDPETHYGSKMFEILKNENRDLYDTFYSGTDRDDEFLEELATKPLQAGPVTSMIFAQDIDNPEKANYKARLLGLTELMRQNSDDEELVKHVAEKIFLSEKPSGNDDISSANRDEELQKKLKIVSALLKENVASKANKEGEESETSDTNFVQSEFDDISKIANRYTSLYYGDANIAKNVNNIEANLLSDFYRIFVNDEGIQIARDAAQAVDEASQEILAASDERTDSEIKEEMLKRLGETNPAARAWFAQHAEPDTQITTRVTPRRDSYAGIIDYLGGLFNRMLNFLPNLN